MTLWIDADAAPQPVKEICLRASERLALATILVANQRLPIPSGYAHVSAMRVDGGPDVADRYIAEHAVAGDVAVTADIPLAALLVPKGVVVLDPRAKSTRRRTLASDSRCETSWTDCGRQASILAATRLTVRERSRHSQTLLTVC